MIWWAIVLVLFAHFVGDFVLQRDSWSKQKSSSVVALTKHVATYTVTLLVFSALLWQDWQSMLLFAGINGAAHWVIDFVTSRITKRLWAQQRVHDFFVVIGFDQWMHYAVMFGSMAWLTAV